MTERELFLEALDQPTPADRERYVGRVAADAPSLGRRLRSLLRSHDEFEAGPPPFPPPPPPQVGDVIGRPGSRYKLLQKLGEGGMGAVWAADQVEPVRRRVAVKLIRDGADHRAVGPRFDQERQALALMDHPHIARVFDAGAMDDGRPYFAMELVKGFPLTEYADAEQLPLADRLALLIPVCRAVQHAHQKGVIHRDLKPSNVLVGLYDGKPVPKVIDFGVAKAAGPRLTDRTVFTRVGSVVGTPQYMAPEQAELNNVDVDTRADVYSLGVILYELVTGTTPLDAGADGGGLLDLLRRVRETDPAAPSARLSTSRELPALAARRRAEPRRLPRLVQGELDWIVLRCLEKDRDRRYQTADELAADLENHLAGRPVLAGPPSRWYRAGKFVRANRRWVAASAALLLALVAVTAASVGLAVRAVRAEGQARDAADRADRERRAQEQEAATARAVVGFLQDVFGQANPLAQGGNGALRDPDLTVRAALDWAAGRLDRAFPDQPLTEAAVRYTLGSAYKSLGRTVDARRQLERAVELRVRGLGTSHPDTLAARRLLATLVGDAGRHAQAEVALREVLAELPAEAAAARRETRHALAVVIEKAGRHADAASMQRELAAEFAAAHGPGHPAALGCRVRLADLDRKLGRLARAEAALREVLREAAPLGDDHPLVISATRQAAAVLQQAGRAAEAEPLADRAVRLATAHLGPTHPDTLAAEVDRATVRLDLGRADEAERDLRALVARAGWAHGADDDLTLTATRNLAAVLLGRGRGGEAEQLLADAVRRGAAAFGEQHPATLSARFGLAHVYFTRQDWDRAEPLYRATIAAGRTADPGYLGSLNNLGLIHRQAGRYAEAEPLMREAVGLATDRYGPGHPTAEGNFGNLFRLYEAWDRWADAERAARDRVAVLLAAGCPDGAVGEAEIMVGRAALRQNKLADAEAAFRSAVGRCDRAGRTDWRAGFARSLLGATVGWQGRQAEAEPLLQLGHEQMTAGAGSAPTAERVELVGEAARRRANNLARLGRAAEADGVLAGHARWARERGHP